MLDLLIRRHVKFYIKFTPTLLLALTGGFTRHGYIEKRCRFRSRRRRCDQFTYLHQADIYLAIQNRENSVIQEQTQHLMPRETSATCSEIFDSSCCGVNLDFTSTSLFNFGSERNLDRMADGAAGILSSQQPKPSEQTCTCGDLTGSVFKHHPV